MKVAYAMTASRGASSTFEPYRGSDMINDTFRVEMQFDDVRYVTEFQEQDLMNARAGVIVDAIGGSITFEQAEQMIDAMHATVMTVRADRKREARA